MQAGIGAFLYWASRHKVPFLESYVYSEWKFFWWKLKELNVPGEKRLSSSFKNWRQSKIIVRILTKSRFRGKNLIILSIGWTAYIAAPSRYKNDRPNRPNVIRSAYSTTGILRGGFISNQGYVGLYSTLVIDSALNLVYRVVWV